MRKLSNRLSVDSTEMKRREFIIGSATAAILSQLPKNANALTHRQLTTLLGGAPRYTYYVDSVNGSDANSGKSPTQAFQNLTAVPTLTKGQSVGLAAGSFWRQQFSSSNIDNITIAGYGNITSATSGAASTLPIISADDVLPNANFVKTAGQTNVYNTASAVAFATSGLSNSCGWINVHEDNHLGAPGGLFLQSVTSIALCDSTPGSYYIPGMTGASGGTIPPATIYIHPFDGSNPITNGYTYDFTNRVSCLFINGKNVTVKNVEVRGGNSVNGSLALLGDNKQCTVNNVIGRHGIQVSLGISGGSTITNCLVINMYNLSVPYLGSQMLSPFDVNGAGLPFTMSGNILQQDQALPGNVTVPLNKQVNSTGTDGLITFKNNWIIGKNGAVVSAMYLSPSGTAAVFDGNYATGITGFYTHYGTWPATISNNQMVVTTPSGGYAGFDAPSNPITLNIANATVTLTNNKFCHIGQYYGTISVQKSGCTVNSSGNLYFLSTSVQGYNGAIVGTSGNNNCVINSSNDDFGTNVGAGNLWPVAAAFVTGWTFNGSNNIYENKNLVPHWTLNSSTAITSLAAWQATAGVTDTGSTESGGNAAAAANLPPIPSVQ